MRSKAMILAALLLAAFLVNLDTTLVNVALPDLVRDLHATTTQLQWVVDAYNLVFAALLLTSGSLSDRFGRKGMLLAGLAVVGAASLAGGLTASAGQLIAARAVMGLGAAMSFPATLSLISNVFTERRERARAIGLWGAIAGVAIAMGPIVGGWLLAHGTKRGALVIGASAVMAACAGLKAVPSAPSVLARKPMRSAAGRLELTAWPQMSPRFGIQTANSRVAAATRMAIAACGGDDSSTSADSTTGAQPNVERYCQLVAQLDQTSTDHW